MSPSVAVAIVLSALIVALAFFGFVKMAGPASRQADRLLPGALAASFALGHALAYNTKLWPSDVVYRMPQLALLAVLSTGVERAPLHRSVRVLCVLGLAGISTWLLLGPVVFRASTARGTVVLTGAVALLVLLQNASRWERSNHFGALWPATVIWLLAVAVGCTLSGSLLLGQLAGILVVSCLALFAVGWKHRATWTGRGAQTVAVTLGFGLLSTSSLYSEMRLPVLAILLAAPLVGGVIGAYWERHSTWLKGLVTVSLGVWAAIVAYRAAPLELSPTHGSSDKPASNYDYGYGDD